MPWGRPRGRLDRVAARNRDACPSPRVDEEDLMQRRFVWCAVALLVAALQSSTAFAFGSPFKFGLGGGASVPVSDAADAFKTGFHGKAMVQWSAPVMPISLRGSVGYERFNLEGLTPGTDGTGRIL